MPGTVVQFPPASSGGGLVGSVSLTTQVSGTLPVVSGGTGATSNSGALSSIGAVNDTLSNLGVTSVNADILPVTGEIILFDYETGLSVDGRTVDSSNTKFASQSISMTDQTVITKATIKVTVGMDNGGSVYAEIYDSDFFGKPQNSIGASDSVSLASIVSGDVDFTFSSPVTINGSGNYHLVVSADATFIANSSTIQINQQSNFDSTCFYYSLIWNSIFLTGAMYAKIYGNAMINLGSNGAPFAQVYASTVTATTANATTLAATTVNTTTTALQRVTSRVAGTSTGISGGANSGSSPTVSLDTGNDFSGKISYTAGSGPGAGEQVVVTFSTPYDATPIVFLTPGNTNAADSAGGFEGAFVTASTSGFAINTIGSPGALDYVWNYLVVYSN